LQIFAFSLKQNGTLVPYIGMKTYLSNLTNVFALFACVLLAASCAEHFPSRYVLELPRLPEVWVSILGEPNWKIEWVDPDGYRQTELLKPFAADILSGGSKIIELPVTWANPITAWPYWPHHNLIPGFFKPAGAIFPFDASGDRLILTWEAGVDAVFFQELVLANEGNNSRLPSNFDWPRFRELFSPETLSEAVCEDPWLVNWRSVAERTVAGNFDRRRLVPEATTEISIPVPAGTWYGTSPFSSPLVFTEDEPPVFKRRPGMNVWISQEGILRVDGTVWVLSAWEVDY